MRLNILSDKRFLVLVAFSFLMVSTAFMVPFGHADTAALVPDWTSVTHDFFNLSPATTEPVITASMVTDRTNVTYVADPFLFHEGSTWYMFFEVNLDGTYPNLPSDIGLATSSDGLHWTYQQIVLHEPFHLAYPYVFKWNGTYYMIPETFNQNEVRLYEATNFPYTWAFVANIASGPGYVDSSIFRYNNTWWLFTSDSSNNTYLYYSDNFADPSSWHSHPMNPIISGSASSTRGGGRVTVFNGNTIIRLAQNNTAMYGQAVRAFQVDTLTTTSYAEHEIPQSPIVQASGSGWNKDGMHTIDPWWIGNRWLAAVDGVNLSPTEVWSIGIYESPVIQYQLTTSTNYGTVSPAISMQDAGSTVTITATPPTADPGERYIFLGWTGSGTGSYTGLNNPALVTMNDNINETATWEHDYYLTVSSDHGTAGGAGWYNSGTSAYATVTPLTVAGATGTQYVFTSWSGDASGTTSPSNAITMNGPKTATANWTTQYHLTFAQSGVASDFSGTVMTVNGTNYGGAGFTTWANASDFYTFSYAASPLVVTANGKQYLLTGVSGNSTASSLTASAAATVTGTYKTQYYLTASSAYDSPSPSNGWFDSGSSITGSVASPVSGGSGTQYVCTGWSGTGSAPASGSASAVTFTITAPSTITWNWKTQYLVSFTVSPSGAATTSPSGTNLWEDPGTISISATPNYGYTFSSWTTDTGNITFTVPTFSSTTATINGPGTITANLASVPIATPTPTPAHTPTPTPSPSPTPTPSPSQSPTASPSSSPSQSPSAVNNNGTYAVYGVVVALILAGAIAAVIAIRAIRKRNKTSTFQ